MYKIGIIGHGPEHFSKFSDKTMKNSIKETLDLLSFQYGSGVIFNIIGEIGVGLWAAEECISENICFGGAAARLYYHLFLPFPHEITSEDWYDDQKELLKKCCDNARSITICNPKKSITDEKPYEMLVEDSSFVIFFWNGKKQGKTFDAIKYSLATNKMAINAMNDMKLITNKDILK